MIVSTAQGRIEGLERNGAWQFRGIPYAAPPVGGRRFRPPEPPAAWDGVRPGDRFGAVAPQAMGGTAVLLGDQGREASEDCLFLNVTTPACDVGQRPVLVWLHGGGYVNGSSSTPWYDGTRMATRGDVVVVSVNYRLGALGFLWLGDLDPSFRSSGVNGLLDQVAALRWVQENIHAFGGDPGNVTVFGESAGAMSASTLLALPSARGLFHKVIAQSGAAANVFTPEAAAGVTSAVMSRIGATDVSDVLEAPASDLVDAAAEITGALLREPRRIAGRPGLSMAMAFEPVIDGEWLPEAPLTTIRRGEGADVPLLIGTNRDEWNLFRILSPGGLDRPELLDRLDGTFGDGRPVHDTYAQGRPEATVDELWSAVLTDAVFRIPANRLLEAHHVGATSPSHQYLFTWASPAFGGVAGSCHALEIPFVFGVLGNQGAELILGGPAGEDLWQLSDAMQDAWIAFARTGDPTHPRLPEWPAWSPERRAVMRLDVGIELLDDPAGDERRLWEGVL